MEINSFVEPLRGADAFHKNVNLMFDDFVASIREKTLSSTITVRHEEKGYWVWNSRESEHKALFVFESASQFRFIQVLVKVHEDPLTKQGSKYKKVCATLEIDPVIPLIFVYGIFTPRDVQGFVGDANRRRNWANNTVLLGVPADFEVELVDPSSYAWNKLITVQTPPGTNSWYCEHATVKLRPLIEFRDQNDINVLVDDLLNGFTGTVPEL